MRIAIVGAGIGGLTVALALADRGHAVTLLERRTGFSEIGAGLQLPPNASRVLVELGLGPALARVAREPEGVVVRRLETGREIGGARLGTFVRERHGAPYWALHRADLQTVLLDAVRGRGAVRLLVGRAVEALEARADGVTLTLSGRSDAVEADLVVAADGVHSRLRAALPGETALRPSGDAVWRASLPMAAVPEAIPRDRTGLWLGRARHVVHYPVSGGRRLNIAAFRPAGRIEAADWGEPGDAASLRAGFADAAEPLAALLARPESWLVWTMVDRRVARPMARGRVALLGDAAHPVLPYLAQGAALAIEDAAVLARCLEEGAPEAALARYAKARAARAERVRREARRNGRVYHAGALVSALRDRVMRRLGAEGMTARYDWLYGWRPDA